MATALVTIPHAEDRSVLREISWETYVRLCDENQSRATQMAYFEGDLEIMTVGLLHESAGERIRIMFHEIADALEVEFFGTGHTTFKHPAKRIGFEADLSFYVTHLDEVCKQTGLELGKDPPPDLVVEVDVSRNSQRKLLMYGALGIPEVWRYVAGELIVYRLTGHQYEQVATSTILPDVPTAFLNRLLSESVGMKGRQWLNHVRKIASDPSNLE
jgi:Uma2 family endonuclease